MHQAIRRSSDTPDSWSACPRGEVRALRRRQRRRGRRGDRHPVDVGRYGDARCAGSRTRSHAVGMDNAPADCRRPGNHLVHRGPRRAPSPIRFAAGRSGHRSSVGRRHGHPFARRHATRSRGDRVNTKSAARWERMGASAGVAAVLLLGVGYAITRTTAANLAASDADYVRALLAERMKWEWVTFVRLVAGTLVVWFMGSLAGRLRTAEGEPGRLATAAFGLGVVWAGVWLLSALFNSSSLLR